MFYEKTIYVSIHGYAAGSLGVLVIIIICKVFSCKLFSFPVSCYLVVLLQDLEKMYCVLLSDIFDAEIIHY